MACFKDGDVKHRRNFVFVTVFFTGVGIAHFVQRWAGVRFPAGTRFYLPNSVQSKLGVHPASISHYDFPGSKAARA
jgi:hypothetical protein